MEFHEWKRTTVAQEVVGSLEDALRWLDSIAQIGGEASLVNMMPNRCRSRRTMREVLLVAKEEQIANLTHLT